MLQSSNLPTVKLGIVAVSRDCFPVQLAERRRAAIVAACAERGLVVVEVKRAVESEADMLAALEELAPRVSTRLRSFWATLAPRRPRRSSPSALTAP